MRCVRRGRRRRRRRQTHPFISRPMSPPSPPPFPRATPGPMEISEVISISLCARAHRRPKCARVWDFECAQQVGGSAAAAAASLDVHTMTGRRRRRRRRRGAKKAHTGTSQRTAQSNLYIKSSKTICTHTCTQIVHVIYPPVRAHFLPEFWALRSWRQQIEFNSIYGTGCGCVWEPVHTVRQGTPM